MKKIIAFALLMVAFVQMNAQNNLFDGIYSGMTSENYLAYCSEHYELKSSGYIVDFDGNSYFIDPLKNANQVIAAVVLTSYFIYSSEDYNGAMLSTVNKIKATLISLNYQQNTDSWPLMSDIKDDCPIISTFINGDIEILIGICRVDSDNVHFLISIYDLKYNDGTIGY